LSPKLLNWRPRRDLNPCYRRENGMAKRNSNKLQEHGRTGWRSRSSKKHVIVSPMCPRTFDALEHFPACLIPQDHYAQEMPMLARSPMGERSLFRATINGPNHLFNQQLNSSRWPIYCVHSVTSADVRLSVGPNLSRAACQRPVDFRQSQAWTGGPSERKSALTSGCPLYGRKPRSPRNEFRFAGRIGDHFHPRAATIWYVFRVGQHKKERASG